METVVVTKNLKNQSVIMGKTVAKLEKLIMQIDSIADQINVGDDTYKMKKIIKSNAINLEQTKDKLKRMSITLDQISKLYESTENDICENVLVKQELLLSKQAHKVPSSISKIPGLFEKIKDFAECIGESVWVVIKDFAGLIKDGAADLIESDNKNIIKWFKEHEPQKVSDLTILELFCLLSVVGISKKQRKKHKSINKVQWEEYLKKNSNPKYIEHQDQMTKFVYGNRNADYNSCEVIAAYNALKALIMAKENQLVLLE